MQFQISGIKVRSSLPNWHSKANTWINVFMNLSRSFSPRTNIFSGTTNNLPLQKKKQNRNNLSKKLASVFLLNIFQASGQSAYASIKWTETNYLFDRIIYNVEGDYLADMSFTSSLIELSIQSHTLTLANLTIFDCKFYQCSGMLSTLQHKCN